MLKSKKLVAMFLTIFMVLSVGCMSAFAEEESTIAMQIGDITEYSLYVVEEVDGEDVLNIADSETKISYMQNYGMVPGNETLIGNKKFLILDDYRLEFLGFITEQEQAEIELHELKGSILRGTGIPTSLGTLPYNGSYNISTFIYTDYYFYASTGTILFTISSNDGKPLNLTFYRKSDNGVLQTNYSVTTSVFGVLGYNNFYVKIQNAGSGWTSGTFNIKND